ncbi:MAG TPA: glycosyltransferase family 2 protein [Solirubrobacterales bacterium]|nr:glycosyltransferase family 2 protein [Solirubrobacterales bacterium]
MSGAGPLVSVIVVAPELNDYGRRCLAALLELDEKLEVIFVPDEPTPEVDPRVLVVPSGADVTTGGKRQLGLGHAGGDYVALIDDDAYPHTDWLRSALAVIEADDSIAAVAGPTLTPPDDSELEQLGGRVYASPLVSGPHRWRYAVTAPADVDDAPSVNLVLRRSEALAVGFDSEDHWGEDTLVTNGLLERGGRIRYEPRAIVFHSRRPLWLPHLRQLYRWSRHRSAYARTIGGNSLRLSYFAPSALVAFLLGGPLLRGRLRRLWGVGAVTYGLACLAAGADRSPSRWLRVSGAIVATHLVYGIGFLVGLAGARPVRR